MKQVVDFKSIGCTLATFCGAWMSALVKTDIVVTLTILVAVTTIIYNAIRIYKELKEK